MKGLSTCLAEHVETLKDGAERESLRIGISGKVVADGPPALVSSQFGRAKTGLRSKLTNGCSFSVGTESGDTCLKDRKKKPA